MIVGTRHLPALKPGRHVFALMSVIALLALACFPVLAHAEDSSGVQYSDAIPKAEGENTPSHHHQTPAKTSSTDKNGGAPAQTGSQAPKGSTEGSGKEGSSAKVGGAPTKGNDGGNGQGSPAGSANHPNGSGVQPGAQARGTTASQKSNSSPLIPILIAILALAAISLGIVWFRQRRQSGPATPPASQKAS
jgi:cobalamin biosynthesis Mg chelatase CobN